ncbi:flavodoxin domain-containing protein [Ruegeria sp. 2205SS24-7]|uniref:flavodoxin domain-containing protein n=1 Tax=Ruegeria discodermiae TaxID=3064389 RepID=UPI0027427BA8|nr:flavodoxin domain-containing protein [Ruegeria sp. 2205SS24-7]MDP5216257.1 flavodoxin domain-containing protein [Ruegeria sp. 2205SS24-7]
MNVLILYASVEGQTRKIARYVEQAVASLGHDAAIFDTGEGTDIPLDKADAVILAAPVHQRRHPQSFEALLSARQAELRAVKTLLLSVSLNAAFPEGVEEAWEYVIEMKMRTGLDPDAEALVAGAVRTTRYDYFAMQVIRHVVLRDQDVDPESGEHVFTDWDALSAEVNVFLAAVQ